MATTLDLTHMVQYDEALNMATEGNARFIRETYQGAAELLNAKLQEFNLPFVINAMNIDHVSDEELCYSAGGCALIRQRQKMMRTSPDYAGNMLIAEWQAHNAIGICQLVICRDRTKQEIVCDLNPKATKTRQQIISGILVAAMHEMVFNQPTRLCFILMRKIEHETDFLQRDFPILEDFFNLCSLSMIKKKVVKTVGFRELIAKWKYPPFGNNDSPLVIRRTKSKKDQKAQIFLHHIFRCQSKNDFVYFVNDECDEGIGKGSIFEGWISTKPSMNCTEYQSALELMMGDDPPPIFWFRWSASTYAWSCLADRVIHADLVESEDYTPFSAHPHWDAEEAARELNFPEIPRIGIGSRYAYNPYGDISSYIKQMHSNLVIKRKWKCKSCNKRWSEAAQANNKCCCPSCGRPNSDGEPIYTRHGDPTFDKRAVKRLAADSVIIDEHEHYREAELPDLLGNLFRKLANQFPHFPCIKFRYISNNSQMMELIGKIRKVFTPDEGIIVPYMGVEDPDSGTNYMNECSNSYQAVQRACNHYGVRPEETTIVIIGTNCFMRSNEFPPGPHVGAVRNHSNETALKQEYGRQAGIGIPKTCIITLGKGATKSLKEWRKNSETSLSKSRHTVDSYAHSRIKEIIDRDYCIGHPALEEAWEKTDRLILNRQHMLAKLGGRGEHKMVGGKNTLKQAHKDGDLEACLFDIWTPEIFQYVADHHQELFMKNGRAKFRTPPFFQTLLNAEGRRRAKQKRQFEEFENLKDRRGKDGLPTELERAMLPYLERDITGQLLGVSIHDGKAYARFGLRKWRRGDPKLPDRDNNLQNLQIQLHYAYKDRRMKGQFIGFRFAAGREVPQGVQTSWPKEGTVAANSMSRIEQKKLGFGIREVRSNGRRT